ncbi:uncharacterized protein N7483_002318 [Penicillium malachiteum]|uniref:uncharacterized protein n=1 Tax=Penicillium malachiteum TaxID=1324776 RepID=UPI0025469955|nr:uncharacterized protein N7483_002318 [Penicillium malachiteum]KAJ5737193.1 hypothetical protein N7483_002318 [Penicillium malachiteum]
MAKTHPPGFMAGVSGPTILIKCTKPGGKNSKPGKNVKKNKKRKEKRTAEKKDLTEAEKEKTKGPKDAMNNPQDGTKASQTTSKNQQTGATSVETQTEKIEEGQATITKSPITPAAILESPGITHKTMHKNANDVTESTGKITKMEKAAAKEAGQNAERSRQETLPPRRGNLMNNEDGEGLIIDTSFGTAKKDDDLIDYSDMDSIIMEKWYFYSIISSMLL